MVTDKVCPRVLLLPEVRSREEVVVVEEESALIEQPQAPQRPSRIIGWGQFIVRGRLLKSLSN